MDENEINYDDFEDDYADCDDYSPRWEEDDDADPYADEFFADYEDWDYLG